MAETESENPPIQYGTFTQRMLASTIDLSIVLMLVLPLVEFLLSPYLPPVSSQKIIETVLPLYARYQHEMSLPAAIIAVFSDPALHKVVRDQRMVERMVLGNLIQFFFVALYTLPFWIGYSATPGKMLFRLEIRDAATGAAIATSPRQCVGRFFSYFLSLIPLSSGFFWISVDSRRRGFHDYAAGTVVVVKPSGRSPSSARQSEGP